MYAIQNTATIVAALRVLMINHNLTAYIVPAGDAHHTEFVAECHQRRAFLSGFTGSAGTAIVSADKALLWTDGRYYLQAEQQLDSALWTLMKDGLPDTLTQAQWLNANLKDDDNVGVDPSLYSKSEWDQLETALKSEKKNLVAVNENLVDNVWGEDKPNCSNNVLIELGMEFSGMSTKEKLRDVRMEMLDNSAEVLVVTELDEVAWLLNLRGNRVIPTSSIFFAYVVISNDTFEVFVNPAQLTAAIRATLTEQVPNITFNNYEAIGSKLNETITSKSGKVWYSKNANYALVGLTPADRQIIKLTPISLMKAVKNAQEVRGYRDALTRDAAAISVFFAWLEDAMSKGERITEISASEKLYSIREERENFMDNSFTTISATGPNGAVIHYMPTPETDRPLAINEMYLLDSGGLYKDGTTDITRTVHFGTPTNFQRECYTRVLKGHIALATSVFPSKLVGHRLDSFARQALWEVGLDYAHGTGHGIGSYLNVHEGPSSISFRFSTDDPGLRENMFTSNEPGYYDAEAGFGIRLENIVRVMNKTLENNFQGLGFLGFDDMTLLPYQHKLINIDLLTDNEIAYLNEYQVKCRDVIGKYIRDHNLGNAALQWLGRNTEPLQRNPTDPTTTPTPSGAFGIHSATEKIFLLVSIAAASVIIF